MKNIINQLKIVVISAAFLFPMSVAGASTPSVDNIMISKSFNRIVCQIGEV